MGMMAQAVLFGKPFENEPEPADYIDAVERIEEELRWIAGCTDPGTNRRRHDLRRYRSALETTLRHLLITTEIRDAYRRPR